MSEHVLSILVKALGASAAAKDVRKLDTAIGSIGSRAQRLEAPLRHFAGRVGQIGTALGVAGIAGGALSVAGALEQGISKTEEMALAVEKLTGVTGMGVHEASQLTAVFGKFGIEGDRVATMAGFAEKTIGKLAAGVGSASDGVSKLTRFEKLYGISLHDNTGKAVDYATEINRVADYYTSNASAGNKAAVASTLLGKNYVALIPILKLGSKGIAEAAKEADALGLTLKSAEDVKNVHDFIAAQRQAKDSIAGLEVQLGLLVMPDLTSALRGLSSFVAGHRGEIQDFFRKGLQVAEGLGAFVTGTLVPDIRNVGNALLSGWNLIPAPLRDMIVQGAIADRTMKFLFGFSPIHTIVDIAESSLAKALGGLIGKAVVQPVFVTNQIPGGGGALGAVGGGATSKLGKLASVVGKVFLVGAAAGAFIELKGILDSQSGQNQQHESGLTHQTGDYVKVAGISEMQKSLEGINAYEAELENSRAAEGYAFRLNIDHVRDAVEAQKTALVTAIAAAQGREAANAVHIGDRADALLADNIRTTTTVRDRLASKLEANRIAVQASTATVRDRIEANRIAIQTAGNKATAAGLVARSGGVLAAAAINAKRLSTSVSVHNTVNVNAQISARDQNHVTVSQSRAYSTIGGVVRAS